MKRNLMLILALLVTLAAAAQKVAITNLKVNANNEITFDISWGGSAGSPTGRTAPWSDTVWVFVDYFNMDKQQMWRLPISSARLTNASWAGAKVRMIAGNNAGFYVEGDARNSGAGTASVSLTPEGDYPSGGVRPCVYVTDYPPTGEYNLSGSSVTAILTGTAPYSVQYSDNLTEIVNGSSFTLPAGKSVATVVDATGSEGTVLCGTAGSSVDLTSDADTQEQEVEELLPIKSVLYTLGGSATGYTITELPPGLQDAFNAGTRVITISGTPRVKAGVYAYTITTTGHTAPCVADVISGSVTVVSVIGYCLGFDPGVIGDAACATVDAGEIGQ